MRRASLQPLDHGDQAEQSDDAAKANERTGYDALPYQTKAHPNAQKYHIEFFRNGLNAIIRLWLAGGCAESPEEMAEVLKQEYRGR